MHAQAIWYDGPRGPELVAANERAGLERIEPAIRAHPELMAELIATIVLRRSDGAELIITITETEAALHRGSEVIMNTELLPGEDPALLRGPDRVDVFEVVHTMLGDSPFAMTAPGTADAR